MRESEIKRTETLLAADRRREIYEAAGPLGAQKIYCVTYSPGGPKLTIDEVQELERRGIVHEVAASRGLFRQRRNLP